MVRPMVYNNPFGRYVRRIIFVAGTAERWHVEHDAYTIHRIEDWIEPYLRRYWFEARMEISSSSYHIGMYVE